MFSMLEDKTLPIAKIVENITNDAKIVLNQVGIYFLINLFLSNKFLVFFTINHIRTDIIKGIIII